MRKFSVFDATFFGMAGVLFLAGIFSLRCSGDAPTPLAQATRTPGGPPLVRDGGPQPNLSPAVKTTIGVDGIQEITVLAGERDREYYFEPSQVEMKPGQIRVKFVNEGERAHTFNVKNQGEWSDKFNFDTIYGDQETTAVFTLTEEGAYMMYCALYGHLDLGQFGTLTVKQ